MMQFVVVIFGTDSDYDQNEEEMIYKVIDKIVGPWLHQEDALDYMREQVKAGLGVDQSIELQEVTPA